MVEIRIGEGEVELCTFEVFEARIAEGRIPADAQIRFEPVTGDAFCRAGDLDLYRSIRDGAAIAWRARFRNSGPPVLTAALVGLQIRIWQWAQLEGPREGLLQHGMNWLSPALENGEPWRLISYGLLHTDFLHILLNMVWMGYTGWNIERALGRANLATIFFGSVFIGGLLSMFLTPGVPSLGASGGVYGLVSASVVFGFVRQDLLPERGRRLFGAALAPYLVLMFLSGLSNPGTDNWAHFGGLVTGAVLALVLDPPGFERRPHQNRRFQIGTLATILGITAMLGLAGPRLYPLVDARRARLDALPDETRRRLLARGDALEESNVHVDVPAGWKPATNSAGDAAFSSPVAERSIAVVQREEERPTTPDEALEAWRKRLRRGHGEVRFETTTPVRWLDADALEQRATLPSGQLLVWRGLTRGVYAFYRVWEMERTMEERLTPLFTRIDASIRWDEPLELQAARRDHQATPRSVRARRKLAMELAKWGEVDEAISLLRSLTEERPEDPTRWATLLELASRHPDAFSIPALVDEALAAAPAPSVIVAASEALRAAGDPVTADGLLQLGWAHAPGERKLRRALRTHGLRWTLDAAGRPNQLVWMPDGRPRSAEALRALLELPLTRAAATELGETLATEREELVRRLEGVSVDAAIALLLRIRDGGMEPAFERPTLLRRDLQDTLAGDPPPWVSPTLRRWLTTDRIQGLLAVLERPTAEDTTGR